MRVRIPTPLRSYTDQRAWVEGEGTTVDEQGRLRPHMKVWVNDDSVRDLSTAIAPTDEITIMQALSGG